MEVLFIRHGQTGANRNHRHQMPTEPLSSAGIGQIQTIAPKIRKWEPTHILTSPHTRAQQSARIISVSTGLSVDTYDAFRELRRPAWLFGKRHGSPASIWYLLRWFTAELVHYDDAAHGETYTTFRKRIIRARSMLEMYPNNARVVVVSHAVFINFFITHVCRDYPLPLWGALPQLLKLYALQNSDYVQLHADADAPENTCSWEMVAPEIDLPRWRKA
jgi:broad specificity phosphatase PhoE